MSKKAQRGAGAEKSRDVQETEDPLQAVVLSDSFETQFSPFTLERPRCLLPLANTPLIEYTLEYLASNGIEEVFVYCSAHTDQIEAYLQASKWTKPHASFRLHILRSTSRSIGDAMRDLDKRAILANDFLVVYGDVVSNVPLGPALAAHRARRTVDKSAIMTMVLREAGSQHRTKANDMLAVFVIDPEKRRCLHYQQLGPSSGGLLLDEDMFKQDIEARADLIDCGIDICTPDVLALWSDNFDYEKPRAGFLHSVLKDYELNGKTVHTHIVNDCYAARVRNLHAYGAVTRDVLEGWSYPFVPHTNWWQDANYQQQKSNVAREDGVILEKTARLAANVIIGSGSSIGASTVIRDSVIGRGCRVGDNCQLSGANVWDNVTIDNNTEVRNAIVASEVKVGARCKLDNGALVSYGVHLAKTTVLGKRKRAIRNGIRTPTKTTNAHTSYELLSSDSEDEPAATGLTDSFYSLRMASSNESTSTLEAGNIDGEEQVPQHRASIASQGSEDSHAGAESFVALNAASINDSLQHGHDASTIQLELQSQRMAQNASEHQVRRAVSSGVCRYLHESQKQGKQVYQVVQGMKPVLERIVFDGKEDKKTDQVDFLLSCQADLAKRPTGPDIFASVCNGLYLIEGWDQEGVFQGDAFEQWWEDARSQKTPEVAKVRDKLQKFIELVTADSEDEDESDSDE